MNPNNAPRAKQSKAKRSWGDWLRWVLTEDHCEWANQYVNWLKTPLGILLCCAVFSLLCGLFVAPQVYLLLAVIAAVVLVGIVWPGIAVRGLRCRLVFTAVHGREGKPTQAKLIVTNRWPWPVWGLAVDADAFTHAVEFPEEAATTPVALARIDGWSRCSYNWTFVPTLRGVYPHREVLLTTGFPFGLRRASLVAQVERSLTVWPETFWLPPLEEHQCARGWNGDLDDQRVGVEGTRLGVREYRVGDNLRDVHWAKSARYDRLIVNEREAVVTQDYRVVVDTDPSRHVGQGPDSTLEWSLRIAASICESVVGQQGSVDLILGNHRVARGAGPEALSRMLDGIARFDSQSPMRQNVPRHRASSGRSAPTKVVSISPQPAEGLSQKGIALHHGSSSQEPGSNRLAPSPWIMVTMPGNVPEQVLHGWRRPARRLQRAR